MSKKDKDPDDYCKGGILTNRALDFASVCLSSYLENYKLLNYDPRITYEKREKAIKKVRKGVEKIDEGKLKKVFVMEELARHAPMIEKDALSYNTSLKEKDEIGLGGFYG